MKWSTSKGKKRSHRVLHRINSSKTVKQRRQWHPTPVLLPGKSHGRRSLEGCSPWGRWGSDTTERLHFHFSLSCIGEGNGNPLQCSCLENPRNGGSWWAVVCGVAQSQTWLKRLSSSSSSRRRLAQLVVFSISTENSEGAWMFSFWNILSSGWFASKIYLKI